MMASREQKRASCGRIKIAAFCAFILCSGLLLRLYELPGFAIYHGHNNVDDGSVEDGTQIQTYISSSNTTSADHQPGETTTVAKKKLDVSSDLESHAEEGMMMVVTEANKSFVEKQDENQPAAEQQQQLAADHGLGVDLHHEEEGEFTSSKIVKSKPTEDPSVARLTGSADDEDKGSLTESQNAREKNETTLTSEEEADGDVMSGAEEVGDELELVPDKDDLVAADEEGGFQQDSDSRFSTNDDTEPDDDAVADWNLPRAIPHTWKPPKPCATAEEMGSATVGDTRAASLRVRRMIQTYLAEYGVDRVKALPAEEFCKHGFVIGQPQQDGFGNNMYKVLSAAGLAIMLNRSLIIGTTPPKAAFGEYLDFSNQTFSMKEVRRLWAIHQCEHKYKRPLIMNIDRFELRTARSARCLCDDWTKSTHPIIWFRGTIDTIGLQYVLKNAHPAMRSAATKLLGNPSLPSSRPNTFGELFRALIAPNPDIQEAVQWVLKGGSDPDISLHLRMLHRKDRSAPIAASSCINSIAEQLLKQQNGSRRPRVVVVSDTTAIYPEIKRLLGQSAEVIQFNYLAYLSAAGGNVSDVMSLHHGEPPRKRIKDWGEMPRWVAMVDFFLAARARIAVVSGAYRRVSTTYAQLVGALAAAYSLDESEDSHPSVYYSSFQRSVVSEGLASQSGWGHTWRPFGGKLGCKNQVPQCAQTALLPYAWWDAPWQSPLSRDIRRLRPIANIDEMGQVSESHMDKFCAVAQRAPLTLVKLMVPTCTEETPCS
ncbi:unnamed protein product [Sphagnum jensenii]|uniref:Uncharacterized protein n=1 Tax=Sphagnum jensenii TaxID=128206 RepID=A0ABP0VWR8_9BRYO